MAVRRRNGSQLATAILTMDCLKFYMDKGKPGLDSHLTLDGGYQWWLKCKTGGLLVNERQLVHKECPMDGAEETIQHFLLDCLDPVGVSLKQALSHELINSSLEEKARYLLSYDRSAEEREQIGRGISERWRAHEEFRAWSRLNRTYFIKSLCV